MNISTEVDDSVLVTNTEENFQVLCTLLYPHVDAAPHIANDPYIRVDLAADAAFYSAGERKQPIISIDLLTQLLMLPTYTARVVLLVESASINDFHPWKNIYEQILRDSL